MGMEVGKSDWYFGGILAFCSLMSIMADDDEDGDDPYVFVFTNLFIFLGRNK